MSPRSRAAYLMAPILLGILMTALLVVCHMLCPMAAGQDRIRIKPRLYIVNSDSCPPCRLFDRVFVQRLEVRRALQQAYDLRELDWAIPAQRVQAMALGVRELPTFIATRGDQRLAVHVGFTMSAKEADIDQALADLMTDIHVEWPPAPDRDAEPERPAASIRPASGVDKEARDAVAKLATQTRDLQAGQLQTHDRVETLTEDVSQLRSEVQSTGSSLREDLAKGAHAARQQLEVISQHLQQSLESVRNTVSNSSQSNTRNERTDISTEITIRPPPEAAAQSHADRPAETGRTASKWLKVLAWAGRTGIAIAAPEVAIPGGLALTAAGVGYQWLRRRRQPRPLGTADNPIRVSEPTEARTETKFVVHETDVLGEAFKEAIRRVGNTHREQSPQIIDVLKQVDSAATQLAHGRRVSRRPALSPVSEHDP